MNNCPKKSFIIFLTILMLASCKIRVVEISIEDCMRTRPSPYKYDEFITRYTRPNTYYSQDTIIVYEISLPKNYDKELYRYTNGQFDFGLQGGVLSYNYNCSRVYFFSADVSITQYLDTIYTNQCDPFNGRKNTYSFPLISEGIDTNGLYWKNINYECENYGYRNVLKEDKIIFDSIVNSIKRVNMQ